VIGWSNFLGNDFGTVINPLIVEGQLHGGVIQASDRR